MDSEKWVRNNQRLRNRVVKEIDGEKKYLLANFTGTSQGKDIEDKTPLIDDFYRVKINVKAWSEKEMQKKDKHAIDFLDNEAVFKSMEKEFDMSYWAFTALGNRPLKDFNNTFIYQLKGCNIFCPWCYVDDKNKNCSEGNGSRFFSLNEIMDVFEKERAKQPLYNFRPSGGEPTLAIEQWLVSLKELQKRGLENEVYLQADTNLTTGNFIKHLDKTKQIEKNLLKKIGKYNNFGLLSSFKGTDKESFLRACGFVNKKGEPDESYGFLERERWDIFNEYLKSNIDAIPFLYDANPKTLPSLIEEGMKRHGGGFLLKSWLFPLKLYGPEKERLVKQGINPEEEQKRLDENHIRNEEVMQGLCVKHYKMNYQSNPRTGIKLRVSK